MTAIKPFYSYNVVQKVIHETLHIVCLRVPYPVNIGANYDLFNKLQALQKIGVTIHLHCFMNTDQKEEPYLLNYCKSVSYYKRTKLLKWPLPFIVSSRLNETLCQNLLKDNFTILVEGTHCSGIVFDKRFENRRIVMRAHNVEYLYYKGLANSSPFGFKKMYYWLESKLLKRYEEKIAQKIPIITLSQSDLEFFADFYKAKSVHYLPIFFDEKINMPNDVGDFCLYHGNLEIPENEKAVVWLLEHVFNDLEIPLVIAGRNPSKKLLDLSHQNLHTCIAANPSENEMNDLVRKAQINVLPSINCTGIKLKILNALYNGRFCITNIKGANGFDAKELFLFAEDAESMKQLINEYINQPYTIQLAEKRKALLEHKYNMETNAYALTKWLW